MEENYLILPLSSTITVKGDKVKLKLYPILRNAFKLSYWSSFYIKNNIKSKIFNNKKSL